MELGNLARLLALASRTSVKLWTVATGSLLFSHDIIPGSDLLTFCFDEEEMKLIAAIVSKDLVIWEIRSGALLQSQYWSVSGSFEAEMTTGCPPIVIKISLEQRQWPLPIVACLFFYGI